MTDNAPIDCHKCRHYYVTWEKAHPHGCRALGFKSRFLPGAVVRSSSGTTCLYFEARRRTKTASGRRGRRT
ncbi:uracil-DNA glycosylase [Desulfatitalea alkaliphila]|uniref:Uracil-DNA glycosylase n=1 Tax=Desulfatitalea alkaliphila TaxID=2929485 RepID=A0AA41R6D9_9BACT|nr:uracil-DNA glycosylase [Desulfatitalea alkaliphila]MCJ8501761.1 uracil-DNA glycosylase [Desulfatitalea alkaliphila]